MSSCLHNVHTKCGGGIAAAIDTTLTHSFLPAQVTDRDQAGRNGGQPRRNVDCSSLGPREGGREGGRTPHNTFVSARPWPAAAAYASQVLLTREDVWLQSGERAGAAAVCAHEVRLQLAQLLSVKACTVKASCGTKNDMKSL